MFKKEVKPKNSNVIKQKSQKIMFKESLKKMFSKPKRFAPLQVDPLRSEHLQACELLREARRALQAEQEERMSGQQAGRLLGGLICF